MSISLTSDQEKFIQTQLESGKYQTPEEVLSTALHLLEQWEKAQAQWREDVGIKIDAALVASEETPPVDGETFVTEILQRFKLGH